MAGVLALSSLCHHASTSDTGEPDMKSTRYEIAIFGNADTASGTDAEALYSATYICDIAGYSYICTDNLDTAIETASLLLLPNGLSAYGLTEEDYGKLTEWVTDGGILVTPALEKCPASVKPFLTNLYGLELSESPITSKMRYIINWRTEEEDMPELCYFDEPEEAATSIGNIPSHAYPLAEEGEAEAMAYFDDGYPAVVRNCLGKGMVYMAAINWRDVILRNQINKDRSASRCYNNGFEPSADVWPLWVRAIVASHKEVSAWKFTVPAGYTQLLIPTHDCDSRTAYDAMHYMADYETSMGCKGHYFLTTHYFRDRDYHDTSYLSAFYDARSVEQSRELLRSGHTVGSHSVCHFPDFNDCRNMDVVSREEYAQRATCVDGKSTGASTWAEVVMSKQILEEDLGNDVRSFRSGHLCNNPDMPEAMVTGNYGFASTYTAGDLLSEFPFFVRMNNTWGGDLTDILQIPLHISDVYNGDKPALNDETWETHPCVDQWESAMNRLRGNYASAVLLIHPNREWKMTLEKRLVERLDPEETGFYNFEEYGDFWRARLNAPCEVVYDKSDRSINIISEPEAVVANKMAFAIETREEPESVIVTDKEGNNPISCRLRQIADGRYLATPDFGTGVSRTTDKGDMTADRCPIKLTDNGLMSSSPGKLLIMRPDGVMVKTSFITDTTQVVSLSALDAGVYIARLEGAPGAIKFHLR